MKPNVSVLKVKFDQKCTEGHSLYVKQHNVRKSQNADAEMDSTLMVLNVPPYCDEKCLRRLFGECGKISSINVQKKPGTIEPKSSEATKFFPEPQVTGFHVAYITYEEKASVAKALKKCEANTVHVLSTEGKEIQTGIKKWCLEYVRSWPDSKKLQDEVDKFMSSYDAKVEEEEQKELETEGVPDDDGWVKVTRRGRNPGFSRTESKEIKIKAKEKRKRKERELLNVYTYQIRESKREKIAELRRKFEEDKQKIKSMRNARKFRPF
uniref:Ribosomal RNA-processing protein 7 homolog A-like n=1 Tax=Phallusia mammillata TaxID=59560 RepID=A0A6F9DQS4_9ASCI|nr:ribosomal RNA-processing protein 7 homolog A-like [Phallusia mammillata]